MDIKEPNASLYDNITDERPTDFIHVSDKDMEEDPPEFIIANGKLYALDEAQLVESISGELIPARYDLIEDVYNADTADSNKATT